MRRARSAKVVRRWRSKVGARPVEARVELASVSSSKRASSALVAGFMDFSMADCSRRDGGRFRAMIAGAPPHVAFRRFRRARGARVRRSPSARATRRCVCGRRTGGRRAPRGRETRRARVARRAESAVKNESVRALSRSDIAPGSSRTVASMMASAAGSPPLSTKSPSEISSVAR